MKIIQQEIQGLLNLYTTRKFSDAEKIRPKILYKITTLGLKLISFLHSISALIKSFD